MNSRTIKVWYQIHKCTSLVCAVFVLLLCLTGLPLIFETEETASNTGIQKMAILPADTPPVSLDTIAAISYKIYPGHSIQSIRFADDEPLVYVQMTAVDARRGHWLTFDNRTAQMLEEDEPSNQRGMTFMDLMRGLHCNLFAGQSGEFLLGFMCLLFLGALASGVILYGPFMKNQAFGKVRVGPPRRVWLDWHKMLGIIALVWAVVVSLTGALLVVSGPLQKSWEKTIYNQSLVADQNQPQSEKTTSVQQAADRVQNALPDWKVFMIEYPSVMSGSPRHYLIWVKGTTDFTSYLSMPILIETVTGELTEAPWYLKALGIARPLHLNNYNTLPLKILWALLDIIAIGMLVSGIYAWLLKHRKHHARTVNLPERQHVSTTASHQSPHQIWSIPIILGALTLFALVVPLLGPGIWQWLSAVALAILLAVICYWRYAHQNAGK
ncbi:MAG TPA: PepSY-associated TM helix domain-containing protein [Methylomusa anaerophila]|uniref:PepSY-associated TM helix n=1 Tax=Methylomusa anaerophila TaxID=1930071 RepID=A0A348AQJ7_9FIRM|nr:PepSY-associated TM helix domain-containing protein [Methylomusa anaerophila]BBB93345.1 pepSY-associated TM helix [Methylomusa anaerophila]HML86825.1 PepSY-associated TM helix domain-containing protein [Methylomusa anaerophila]